MITTINDEGEDLGPWFTGVTIEGWAEGLQDGTSRLKKRRLRWYVAGNRVLQESHPVSSREDAARIADDLWSFVREHVAGAMLQEGEGVGFCPLTGSPCHWTRPDDYLRVEVEGRPPYRISGSAQKILPGHIRPSASEFCRWVGRQSKAGAEEARVSSDVVSSWPPLR